MPKGAVMLNKSAIKNNLMELIFAKMIVVIITPSRAPWKDIPPCHTFIMSIGLDKKYEKL